MKSEDERIEESLLQIGLRVSPETRKHILLTFHSCAMEGCSLTLEETAQNIGLEIKANIVKKRKKA